jgi:hypothetical protein
MVHHLLSVEYDGHARSLAEPRRDKLANWRYGDVIGYAFGVRIIVHLPQARLKHRFQSLGIVLQFLGIVLKQLTDIKLRLLY